MAVEDLQELRQRLNEMEKRLKVAEDIEQIKQLQIRYMNAHTFGNMEDELSCYTENGMFDGSDGATKIQDHMAGRAVQTGSEPKSDVPLPDAHFVLHPIISVDGDRATGHWVNYDFHSHARTYQPLFWIQGIYDAEYVREKGEWKISFLKWTPRIQPHGTPPWDAPLGTPLPKA